MLPERRRPRRAFAVLPSRRVTTPAPTRLARAAPYLLAALWLAAAFANVARGAAHTGASYREWAFAHHCYSDVLAMGGDRYYGGGRPVPYLEDRIEYPVLLGLALWAPSFAPGGPLGHLAGTALLLAACLAAALWALARIPGARPLWLAGTPALAYYALLNWDLLPIALLALAALATTRAHPASAGALTGLGVSAKLFPGVLVPPALAAAAAWDRRGALRFAAALAAVLLAVNAPLALLAPSSWSWFFRFNAGRGAENSIGHALGLGRGPLLDLLWAAPLLAASVFGAWAAFRAARRRPHATRAVVLAAALALLVWIATNKIWSPQYALYGFLAAALAAAPAWAFVPLTALSAADFHVAFEVRARQWDPWFRDTFFHPLAVVRTLAWLALAAFVARALWREAAGEYARRALRPRAREEGQ